MELLFASHNAHKLEEIRALTGGAFAVKGLTDMGFTGEIPEDCDTLDGNACQKARFAYEKYGVPCFADDTGLEVDALHGAPGVYSARYAGVDGSMEERSAANVRKLLSELQGVTGRTARFRTVICFWDGSGPRCFEGCVEGRITEAPRGSDGFGYDPVFLPDEASQTFAEMPLGEKNLISHRARALARFKQFLDTYEG